MIIAVFRKSRELFGPEKPFVKLRPAYSVKLVFSYVVKGIKIKITAKFRASRRLRFEDTKRIMSPEIHPKGFGTFEKQAPGVDGCIFSEPLVLMRERKKNKKNNKKPQRLVAVSISFLFFFSFYKLCSGAHRLKGAFMQLEQFQDGPLPLQIQFTTSWLSSWR